ncbi:SMP-30/gluconolactonase/LRE family protein [Streptomyces sp. NPDC002306]
MTAGWGSRQTTVILKDLHFAEAPSWGPDDALYVSDFYAHEVLRIDLKTKKRTIVAKIPGQPSGIGWLPDGRMLVVSMRDQLLLRLEPNGALVPHADLSSVALGAANDMLVDGQGRAWVGCFGFDFYALVDADPAADPLFGPDADPPTAPLIRVDRDGSVHMAARGLAFPNGMTQLSDSTLIVAETVGMRLTAFTVYADGSLTDRRIWADLRHAGADGGGIRPDGICADSNDAIWVSDPVRGGAVLVDRAGRVLDMVQTSQPCFAVGLAGADRMTLVCCTAATSNPSIAAKRRTGHIETTLVRK